MIKGSELNGTSGAKLGSLARETLMTIDLIEYHSTNLIRIFSCVRHDHNFTFFLKNFSSSSDRIIIQSPSPDNFISLKIYKTRKR